MLVGRSCTDKRADQASGRGARGRTHSKRCEPTHRDDRAKAGNSQEA